MIRANLGLDPAAVGYEEWATQYASALWLEQYRLRNLATLLSSLLGNSGG